MGARDGRYLYHRASATSAAAYVSEAAALIMNAHPDLSPARVRQVMTESAIDIGPPGIDAVSGFGRVDAYLATQLPVPALQTQLATAHVVSKPGASHLTFQAEGFQAGESIALWVTGADPNHWVERGITALGTETVTAAGERSGKAAEARTTVMAKPANPAFAAVAPYASTPDRTYFAETGHSLSGGFKTYWVTRGGLAIFGFPISE